jgi:hypothetical protein
VSPRNPFLTYVKAAFHDWYNYAGLLLFGGLSVILGDPGPALMGAGLELAYLYYMSTNPRFIRSVDARLEDAKHLQIDVLRDHLWQDIHPQLQAKYTELERLTQRMRAEFTAPGSNPDPLQQDNYRKIIMLLGSYLKIARAVTRYGTYLSSVNPRQIEQDIARLEAQLEGADERVLGVRKKNIDVLQKRLEKIRKARANQDYLIAQMEAIEDTMRLVVDQAITLSDPKGTGMQIDNLLVTLQETELISSEMEYYNELEQGLSDDVIDLPSTPAPRPRQRQ